MTPIDLHAIPRAPLTRAQLEKPWVRRIGPRSYRVVGRNVKRGKYTVRFYVVDGKRFGDCECPYHRYTGKVCKHLCASLIRHLRNAARIQNQKEAA